MPFFKGNTRHFQEQAEKRYASCLEDPENIINTYSMLRCYRRLPLTQLEADEYNLYRWRRKRSIRKRYSKAKIPLLAPGVKLKSLHRQRAKQKALLETEYEWIKDISLVSDLFQKKQILKEHKEFLLHRFYIDAQEWYYEELFERERRKVSVLDPTR